MDVPVQRERCKAVGTDNEDDADADADLLDDHDLDKRFLSFNWTISFSVARSMKSYFSDLVSDNTFVLTDRRNDTLHSEFTDIFVEIYSEPFRIPPYNTDPVLI